jgi:LacI family transcriptional regulator
MAINDQVAIGAMRVLMENDLSVPDDVSLIGFDNLDCSSHLHPTLASVDQRIEYFTEEAVRMLVKQIVEGPQDEVEAKLVEPELVLGESMAPAGK